MEFLPYYFAAGAVAGTLAGLFGIGGGMIIVPVLVLVFTQQGINAEVIMHLALGTSLTTIVATALSSVIAHHRRGAVEWPLVVKLIPGIALGAVLGGGLADLMSRDLLQQVFAIGALLIALRMLFIAGQPAGTANLPGPLGLLLAGNFIGAISALCGIGGGTLTVPYLTHYRVPMTQAVATAAACGLPIALFGSLSFMFFGWSNSLNPAYSSGFVYWPAAVGVAGASVCFAPLGARLAHSLPAATMKRLFALLLLAVGVAMLLG